MVVEKSGPLVFSKGIFQANPLIIHISEFLDPPRVTVRVTRRPFPRRARPRVVVAEMDRAAHCEMALVR